MTTPLRTLAIVVAVALVGVAAVLYAWDLPPFSSAIQTTEDAYVRGSVTLIAPKVDGYVEQVLVKDFDTVSAGQLLVKLDDANYQQKLQQARATLAAQEANLANFVQSRRAKEAELLSRDAAIETADAQRVNSDAQLARTLADERRVDALVSDGSISIRRACCNRHRPRRRRPGPRRRRHARTWRQPGRSWRPSSSGAA